VACPSVRELPVKREPGWMCDGWHVQGVLTGAAGLPYAAVDMPSGPLHLPHNRFQSVASDSARTLSLSKAPSVSSSSSHGRIATCRNLSP
jgi:hypothetical protein